jgi:hypothetical protein
LNIFSIRNWLAPARAPKGGTILTFGSCLSRWTANHYARRYDAEVVSTTYHNRSDRFLEYVVAGRPGPDWDALERELCDDRRDKRTKGVATVLRNQNPKTTGLHLMKGVRGARPLLDLRKQVDLVFIDNHMDLGGRLWSKPDGAAPFFMRKDYAVRVADSYELGDYLSAEQSAAGITAIIKYFRERFRNARIVFLHFPFNTYPEESGRPERTRRFYEVFQSPETPILPAQHIPDVWKTQSKSHFAAPYYAQLAETVHATIGNR